MKGFVDPLSNWPVISALHTRGADGESSSTGCRHLVPNSRTIPTLLGAALITCQGRKGREAGGVDSGQSESPVLAFARPVTVVVMKSPIPSALPQGLFSQPLPG
jgi:hypothetical protein